jgi:hypothetical protein
MHKQRCPFHRTDAGAAAVGIVKRIKLQCSGISPMMMLTCPMLLLLQVITKRIKLQGFIVGDYAAELGREFHEEMSQHVLTGAALSTACF